MYHLSSYWDDRYKEHTELFDFYCQITLFQEEFTSRLNFKSKILIIGQGTSRAPFQLYDLGFKFIKCIDFSKECYPIIEKHMKTRPEIDFQVNDVTNFTDTDKYDFILDKGCLDCVISCPQAPLESFEQALSQCKDKLADNGVILSFTFDSEREELINEAFPDQFSIEVIEKKIEVDGLDWGQPIFILVLKALKKSD